LIPSRGGVAALRDAAADCRACPLWRNATQTVFGAGPARADIVLVGEQPGDREDRDGRPFVGPAGGILDRAMAEAGLHRDAVYLTNAVKHFKFKSRGKRRIHQTPAKLEVDACRPWLESELARIKPRAVGLMGATAAKALMGGDFRVSERRGQPLEVHFAASAAVAMYHPSSILRGPQTHRADAFAELVADLRMVQDCASSARH
jgi:DNA polymerase